MARPLGKVSAAVPRVQPVAAAKVRRQKAPRRLHDGKFVVSRDDWDYEDPWAPPGRENDEPQPPHTPPVPAPVPLFQMDEAAALRDEAHAALTAAAAREAALTQREAEARAAAEAAAEREKALRASFSEHVAGLEAALRTATAEHSRVAASAAESERVAQAAISEAEAARRAAEAARRQLLERDAAGGTTAAAHAALLREVEAAHKARDAAEQTAYEDALIIKTFLFQVSQ